MANNTQSNRSPASSLPSPRPVSDPWSADLTRAIGHQIRHWRRRRKLTTQQLSDATAKVGQRIPATVLTNLEHKRRDYIAVAELLVVAAALNVPPVLLVVPIGKAERIESLPGNQISPWRTRGWLMGAIPPMFDAFNLEQWNDATTVIKLYDTHRLLVRGYQEATQRLKELDDDRMDIYPGRQWPQDSIDQRTRFRRVVLSQLAAYLEQLNAHRKTIEDLGFLAPALPPEVEADLTNPLPSFDNSEHGKTT